MLRTSSAALAAVSLFLTACGYIGGVQPPLANIPGDPTALAAVQRGSSLYVNFKLPELTTELKPVPGDLELDLRAGIGPKPWNPQQWAASARKIENPLSVKNGLAQYRFPFLEWTGKEVTIAARVIGANHKASGWSNVVTLPIVAPLPAPTDLAAASTAQGVRLTWKGAAQHFRILRREGTSGDFSQVGASTTNDFVDASAQFGTNYTYLAQAYTDLGDHHEAQSDLSQALPFTPKDTFPPVVPTGLRATASATTIELSWNGNTEPDLAGYRIYRSVNGGAFEKVGEAPDLPTYSDKAVERGKTYRYAVTAVDKSGNESQRSEAAEASL